MNKNTRIIYENEAGSVTFDVAGDFWIEEITGLQTDVDMITTQNVGQLGVTANGQAVKSKEPTFNGYIVRNMESRRAQMLAVILPRVFSRISFFLENGDGWYLEGWPTQTPQLSDGLGPQHFQFRFLAPYPYFRSTETKAYQLTGLTPLWRTPFHMSGTKRISQFTENAFCKVENSGSVPQAITLDVVAYGEVSQPEIWCVDVSRRIGISKVMQPGERFRISTHDRDRDAGRAVQFFTADGEVSNGFRYITPDSDLGMMVGIGGNVFTARAAANTQNLRCILVTAGGERHSI